MMKAGLLKAIILSAHYQRQTAQKKQAFRERRVKDLVSHARKNSPYYAALYRDLPTDWRLSDLPPVNKLDLMSRFDDWMTDRAVNYADIHAFMQNLDNVGRKFHGRYLVFSTSGSTGNPLIALTDQTTTSVMGGVNILRSFSNKEDLAALFQRGGKTIGIFATGGFYLSNGSIRARLLAMPWKRRQMAITSALLPIPEIVSQLNSFQPAMLGGYPSQLDLLVDEQTSGRLHISPVIIMTGGEYLCSDVRARLTAAFHCHVQTSYSCTEGGTIAYECREKHFHINDDWVIVEPVDLQNNPVPDGVRSDKLLLTNLFNYAQPFIRYELTDRVTRHSEPCPCGNPAPWLTLEGRTDDVVILDSGNDTVKIAPLSIYAVLKEVHTIRRFQLLCHPENRLELRLEPMEGATLENAFLMAKDALQHFLHTQGVEQVSISLSSEPPMQHSKSGKFQHIIRTDK